MTIEQLYGFLLLLAPYDPPARLHTRAEVIAAFARTEEEAAAMMAVDLHETTLGRRGVPWGAVESRACTRALEPRVCGEVFARVWRRTASLCGVRHIGRRFALWHTGSCSRGAEYERSEVRTYRRVLRWFASPPVLHPSCFLFTPGRRCTTG